MRRGWILFAWNQRVACPLLGDRDIEHCLSCPFLQELDLEASDPWVRCRAPGAAALSTIFGLHAE